MPLKDVDIEESQGHAAAVEEFALTIRKDRFLFWCPSSIWALLYFSAHLNQILLNLC